MAKNQGKAKATSQASKPEQDATAAGVEDANLRTGQVEQADGPTVESGSVTEIEVPAAPTDEEVAAALADPGDDTADDENAEDDPDADESGDEPAPSRAEVLARLASGTEAVRVETAPVRPALHGTGKEVDWTGSDDQGSTVLVTSTMVTHGYLSAYAGDKLTAPKDVAERLLKLGAVQETK